MSKPTQPAMTDADVDKKKREVRFFKVQNKNNLLFISQSYTCVE